MEPDPAGNRPRWNWSCNRCGVPVTLRAAGSMLCPGCGGVLTVRRDPSTGELTSPSASAVEEAAFTPHPGSCCATHATEPAIGACERCGDFACVGCTRYREGRLYCRACLALLWQQQERTGGRRRLLVFLLLASLVVAPQAILMVGQLLASFR